MPVNNLFFVPLINVSPKPTEKWRFATKTSNTYDNILTVDMVFDYTDIISEFNLTSVGPSYSYMTLFHMGTTTSTNGVAVVLRRKDLDTNPIEIGLIILEKNTPDWVEITGSFVSLSSFDGGTSNPDTDSFMFMFQYDYTGTNTIINFYVIRFVAGIVKTAPDFTFETTTAVRIQPIGNQWGFGSIPESVLDINGYTSTNSYNSYVAQNLSVDFVRTWNTLVPISSTSDEFAIFNSVHQNKSIYDVNRSGSYLDPNTSGDDTVTPNLNFQLFVPDNNFVLANLTNNAIEPAEPVTVTESTTNFQTLNPPNSYDFAVNSSSGYNIVTASSIACLLKGTYVLTKYGYQLVEKLKEDDILITHDNRETKIKKIEIVVTNNKKNPPYVVKTGQFNAFKDLYLSFGHSLLIDDIFMPAYTLSELEKKCPDETIGYYYLLMTENFHKDVIIANGVMVETWGGGYPPHFQVEGLIYETETKTGYNCRIMQK